MNFKEYIKGATEESNVELDEAKNIKHKSLDQFNHHNKLAQKYAKGGYAFKVDQENRIADKHAKDYFDATGQMIIDPKYKGQSKYVTNDKRKAADAAYQKFLKSS